MWFQFQPNILSDIQQNLVLARFQKMATGTSLHRKHKHHQ